MTSINKCLTNVRATKPRSAWSKGVRLYAIDMLNRVKEDRGGAFDLNDSNYHKVLLYGAKDWQQYSEAPFALYANYDIAKRLCNKSEFARCQQGQKDPNPREDWLKCQARALHQAESLVWDAIIKG